MCRFITRTAMIDPLSHKTTFAYDALNRLTTIVEGAETGGPNTTVLTLGYTLAGHRCQKASTGRCRRFQTAGYTAVATTALSPASQIGDRGELFWGERVSLGPICRGKLVIPSIAPRCHTDA